MTAIAEPAASERSRFYLCSLPLAHRRVTNRQLLHDRHECALPDSHRVGVDADLHQKLFRFAHHLESSASILSQKHPQLSKGDEPSSSIFSSFNAPDRRPDASPFDLSICLFSLVATDSASSSRKGISEKHGSVPNRRQDCSLGSVRAFLPRRSASILAAVPWFQGVQGQKDARESPR